MHTQVKFGCVVTLALLAGLRPAQSQAPLLFAVDPPTNSVVRTLTFIDVLFDGAVTNVDASDLLINGTAAKTVAAISPREYLFSFPQPPTGSVSVAFASSHGITDVAMPPHPFGGGSWTYTLDPNAVVTTLLITELLADNGAGIKDEDGVRSDWIEVYNPGPDDANLDGWYLTDETNNLAKWRLPAVFLAVNKYLLVWASGNDRTNPAAPLHANFKLSKEG